MSWNKIECKHCNKEVSPREVIRSNGSKIQRYYICPKCDMPISQIDTKGSIGTEMKVIEGLSTRHSIEYPQYRHINNVRRYRYDGNQHVVRQEVLNERLSVI